MMRLLKNFKSLIFSIAEGIKEFKSYKQGKLK
jgi:hypothetical protein